MSDRRTHLLTVSEEQFEELVRRALEGLPSEYRRLLKNVAVVVEEEPSRELLNELGLRSPGDLLGLYSGIAHGKESFFDAGGHMPPRVTIFRRPILRLCRTPDEVVEEVRDTVAHEIGHHFGLDDHEMPY